MEDFSKEQEQAEAQSYSFWDACIDISKDDPPARELGARFERLCAAWLMADPYYASVLEKVWLWDDFARQLKKDLQPGILSNADQGIDLVARTQDGEFWAVQCKYYSPDTVMNRAMVDSFVAECGKRFVLADGEHRFSRGVWMYSDGRFGSNAEDIMAGQSIPFTKIPGWQMAQSGVDWHALVHGSPAERTQKKLLPHQKEALEAAHAHFAEHDRGKLIMACGTGKTFTSLKIVEQELAGRKGLVLFLVPSIALLGQTLNAWMSDCDPSLNMKAVCVCSDAKASQKFKKDDDVVQDGVMDLAFPASTNAESVYRQLKGYRDDADLIAVFSTYQSLEVVAEAQRLAMERLDGWGVFDFAVCDEAHRTTGSQGKTQEASSFVMIHDETFIKAKKRIYMTATPRMYGEAAKKKAAEAEALVWSMDDESVFGMEFYRVNFSYAVQHGLLTDYKVLILTVPASTKGMPAELAADIEDPETKELKVDFVSQLMGTISALSKHIAGDRETWIADPSLMKRGLVFCGLIGKDDVPGSSKNVAFTFAGVSEKFAEMLSAADKESIVHVQARHVDGSMGADERNAALAWLREDAEDQQECRLLCNVRCLSEGIDVPALDAVVYLSPRRSEIDVVQSVGRIMRNFRKGKDGEKKFGYIILPVVVPAGVSPEAALNDNKRFQVVWKLLNALRAHDDHFNAMINQIALNEKRPDKIVVGEFPGDGEWWWDGAGEDEESRRRRLVDVLLAESTIRDLLYGKIVEKVGDRGYWDRWSTSVGKIAQQLIGRIGDILQEQGEHRQVFDAFLAALRENLNPSVSEGQAVEMLAQFLVTGPVFDALFKDYDFGENNPVSRSMQTVVRKLEERGLLKDTEVLQSFYASVQQNVGMIDNPAGRQEVVRNLYEKFFKGAFPKTVEQLGIVYTPVEVVDFVLRSAEAVLQKEFGRSMSDEGVHVLDPFAGTGTFVARLLESGMVRDEDLLRKYREEIHANEIVLLAYYVADVNIETVFNGVWQKRHPGAAYERYDGIALTDTFEQYERKVHAGEARILPGMKAVLLGENTAQIERQQKAPIRVIVGNPPYSVGQKSANDGAKNQAYPKLDRRIADTYAAGTQAANKNSLYDTYIKAFRWASDRIPDGEGGVVAFVTNAGWLDGAAASGMRKCLEEEFSAVYVVNLRGDCRTSGELRRKEGDNIFALGSRTPVAVTILIKKPGHEGRGTVHYYAVGDYLKREEKLKLLKETPDVFTLSMNVLETDGNGGWLYQRNAVFDSYINIGDKKNKPSNGVVFCEKYSNGLKTNADNWMYNYSLHVLLSNMDKFIKTYNEEVEKYKAVSDVNFEDFCIKDEKRIKWHSGIIPKAEKGIKIEINKKSIEECLYRPFVKQFAYNDRNVVQRVSLLPNIFPNKKYENLAICISSGKNELPLIVDCIPDLHFNGDTQCFPLYWYEEETAGPGRKAIRLPGMEQTPKLIRRDGVTNWALEHCRKLYSKQDISKEDVFYFVYGILHSREYRSAFGEDLKKSLPHIPFPDSFETFDAFSRAGRCLADISIVAATSSIAFSASPVE